MMAIIIINYINSTTFAGYIGLIASGLFGMNPDRVAYMIDHLSPKWSIDMILLNVRAFNPSLGTGDILFQAGGYLLVLVIYLILFTVLSYIIFVRRDVK